VLPSRREPYGTVYGEALAVGLPVVGWRAGNLVHLAGDEGGGVMVEPGDVRGLAAALERLAVDEPFRRHLGQAAAARGRSLPTWTQSAARFFSLLREVAGAGG
jgi:glycosyltransferase involved in cell wall biosynthesis